MSFAALAIVLVALRLRSRLATASVAAALAFATAAVDSGADRGMAEPVAAADQGVVADRAPRLR